MTVPGSARTASQHDTERNPEQSKGVVREMLIRTRSFPSLTFSALDSTFDSIDRAFEELTNAFFAATPRSPVVDASWHDGDLHLTVDLPGVPAENIDVSVAGRTLTLKADLDHGHWERSMTIGAALDPEKVSATYLNGRLTVVVGAMEKPEVRRIEISTSAPAPAAIESSSSDAQPAQEPEKETTETA
jgi:HSP20 family protein